MSLSCADSQLAFWKGADGELSPEESKELVDHLRACGNCRAAVRQASRAHRILLEASVDARSPSRRAWAWPALAAAGVLLAAGMTFLLMRGGPRPQDKPSEALVPKAHVEEPRKLPEPELPKPEPVPPAPDPVTKPEPEKPPPPPIPPAPKPPELPPVQNPVVPEPPKPTPAPPRKTEVSVARLEKVEGEVFIISGIQKARAQTDGGLVEGQGLAVGAKGAAWLLYSDKTRVKLGPDTEILERGGTAKRLQIVRGTVTAEVARQPVGQPMVFSSAHGEATVLGTTLRLLVDVDKTRLEVTEGSVKLTRRDGKSVDVLAGHYAVAAAGVEPAAKALPREGRIQFTEDFDDTRRIAARWILQEDSFPVSFPGKAVFDVSPRGKGPQGTGVNWTVATGGLQTREAVRVPFRISLDVEGTGGSMFPWVRLLPAPLKKNSKRMISIERRPPQFELRAMDDQGKTDATTFGRKPEGAVRRERWMLEIHATEIVVWVGDEERDRVKHGLTLAPAYLVALGASAQQDVPKDSKVEFDDVIIELLKE